MGLVGLWDCVAFDEAAGIHFKDKDGIQSVDVLLKTSSLFDSFPLDSLEMRRRVKEQLKKHGNCKLDDYKPDSCKNIHIPISRKDCQVY